MGDDSTKNALAVNPSLYPQAPAPGASQGMLANPLGVLQAAAQAQQFQQAQQMFAAKKAAGAAMQSAITQGQDGSFNVDPSKALAAIKMDPNAGLVAPESISSILDYRRANIANATGQFGLALTQSNAAMNSLGALAGKPGLTDADVYGWGTTYARMTGTPSGIINGAISNAVNDPGGVAAGVTKLSNAAMDAASRAQRTAGPPGAGGAPTSIPLGAAGYGGSVTTGLPPGAAEAQSASAKASADALTGDLIQAHGFQRQIYPLTQSIQALQNLGPTGTGPGSDTLNGIQSFLQSSGIPGMNSAKIENFDLAKKYLTDYVNQTGNTGTNDKLAAAFAGNPSVNISNAAAVDVAKSALALRRMQQGQVLAFGQTGLPDSAYTKWAAGWQTNQDPRAYGVDLMTPAAKQALETSLGAPSTPQKPNPTRDRFMSSLAVAGNAKFPLLNLSQQPAAPPQGSDGQ